MYFLFRKFVYNLNQSILYILFYARGKNLYDLIITYAIFNVLLGLKIHLFLHIDLNYFFYYNIFFTFCISKNSLKKIFMNVLR